MYNCYKSENHNTPTFDPVAVSGVNLQPVALNIKESLQFDMSIWRNSDQMFVKLLMTLYKAAIKKYAKIQFNSKTNLFRNETVIMRS